MSRIKMKFTVLCDVLHVLSHVLQYWNHTFEPEHTILSYVLTELTLPGFNGMAPFIFVKPGRYVSTYVCCEPLFLALKMVGHMVVERN